MIDEASGQHLEPGRAALPLGVRILAALYMWTGVLGVLCVGFTVLAAGLAWAAVLLAIACLSAVLIAVGVGLYRGQAWPIPVLKVLLGLAVAAGVLLYAWSPLMFTSFAVPMAVAGLVLAWPVGYLGRPEVRACLWPAPIDRPDRLPPSARKLAARLRPIGGFGLFAWGVVVALGTAVAWWQALEQRDVWGELLLPVMVWVYALPCIVMGLLIWRARTGLLADLIGLALALAWTVQLLVYSPVPMAALAPLAVSIALTFGLLAPRRRRAPTDLAPPPQEISSPSSLV